MQWIHANSWKKLQGIFHVSQVILSTSVSLCLLSTFFFSLFVKLSHKHFTVKPLFRGSGGSLLFPRLCFPILLSQDISQTEMSHWDECNSFSLLIICITCCSRIWSKGSQIIWYPSSFHCISSRWWWWHNRYQFFLQLKQDILHSRLPVPVELIPELFALVIQCECLFLSSLQLFFNTFVVLSYCGQTSGFVQFYFIFIIVTSLVAFLISFVTFF